MAAWVSRPLLLASMLVLVGHVCAGSAATPGHPAAAPPATDSPDGHDESLHAASCDAVAGASATPAVADAGAFGTWDEALRVSPASPAPAPEPVPRPPRFLLHAALRI